MPPAISEDRDANGQTPKRNFRMGHEDYETLREAAEKRGLTVSEIIRSGALKEAYRLLKRKVAESA